MIRQIQYSLFSLFFMLPGMLPAQLYFGTSPNTRKEVVVLNESKEEVQFPWAGGLNSCQFGEVDMNMDGIRDLFVFDRTGDRILTFINGGTQNQVDYSFAPEYVSHFPDLYDWAILKDYNNDGLEDIFTYARDYPGIIVYKNVSAGSLAFELEVYPFLTSFQGGGQVNILTTDVDYPGIEDIDNDGDLDILTFWGLGSFVEYHQNQSMDLYGIPDSLEFVEVTQCWGHFAESDESNVIYLDTCMGQQESLVAAYNTSRHTGSTFLLMDVDDDNDQDLLLGDVDFPNLVLLVNGGNSDSAYMISQDNGFPSYDKPVNLFSMPAAAYIDVDNDGARELLLSPFDPSLVTSANYRSVWLYENTGSSSLPQFSFVQQDFLQEDMIDVGSGAYPVLEDYNGDGLLDLFVGNFGYYIYSFYDQAMILHSVYWSNLALYENTGTADAPKFTRVTHNFAGLHNLQLTALYPAFGDLDGDGDRDMLLGRKDGSLIYLENKAGGGEIPEYNDPLPGYQDIDVGEFSAPQLWDLDGDGLTDLVIGEQNGNLNYYRNTGSVQSAQYTFVTDSLGKVNVTDYNLSYSGFSTPCFFKTGEGATELLVGSEQGKVFYFRNIDNNLEGEFEESDSLFLLIGDETYNSVKAIRSAAAIGELNGDDEPELIVGNFSGGLQYFKGIDQPPVSGFDERNHEMQLLFYPNPAIDRIQLNPEGSWGDLLIDVYDAYGRMVIHARLNENKRSFSIRKLAPGIYYARCRLSEGREVVGTGRFVKIKP